MLKYADNASLKKTFLIYSSEGIVYNVDEMTGGLVISHRLRLPTRDYPGCPGPVSCMKWTPDGTALAMAWERGGFSIWSTFGAMIMCSLCWDYGPLVSDPVGKELKIAVTVSENESGHVFY